MRSQSQHMTFPESSKRTNVVICLFFLLDGERCAETLRSIFENAKHPEKVFVGVVEQNGYEDANCLDNYCKFYGM